MRIGVQKFFDFVDPRIHIERMRQSFELNIFVGKVLVEFDVEKFEKVCPFISQSAIDLDEGRSRL